MFLKLTFPYPKHNAYIFLPQIHEIWVSFLCWHWFRHWLELRTMSIDMPFSCSSFSLGLRVLSLVLSISVLLGVILLYSERICCFCWFFLSRSNKNGNVASRSVPRWNYCWIKANFSKGTFCWFPAVWLLRQGSIPWRVYIKYLTSFCPRNLFWLVDIFSLICYSTNFIKRTPISSTHLSLLHRSKNLSMPEASPYLVLQILVIYIYRIFVIS